MIKLFTTYVNIARVVLQVRRVETERHFGFIAKTNIVIKPTIIENNEDMIENE